jgi:hypothetical protein
VCSNRLSAAADALWAAEDRDDIDRSRRIRMAFSGKWTRD